MIALSLRAAGPDDASRIATLHADSWRRHYRGAYADSYLDGDVVADRRAVWTARLAAPTGTATVLAEEEGRLVGFVHVVLDADPRWGNLLDNLHVVHDRQRSGIGATLVRRAAEAIVRNAASDATYLWVLEQNTGAQRFYQAMGGSCVERAAVPPPGGVPSRLNGAPDRLRIAWPDAASLVGVGEVRRPPPADNPEQGDDLP